MNHRKLVWKESIIVYRAGMLGLGLALKTKIVIHKNVPLLFFK